MFLRKTLGDIDEMTTEEFDTWVAFFDMTHEIIQEVINADDQGRKLQNNGRKQNR